LFFGLWSISLVAYAVLSSHISGTDWVRGGGLGSSGVWTQNDGSGCEDFNCKANEEFADMFLNWAYDVPNNNVFTGNDGQGRRNFMNTRMKNYYNLTGYGWIDCLFDLTLGFCP
jgi:hypothetical protein